MVLDPVTAALIATAITSLVGLLATIAGFVFTYVRAEQQTRNDREDRRELAAKEKEDRERTDAKRVEQLLALQNAIDQNTTKTVEVGGKADNAYTEANSVNLKIVDLHKENAGLHEEIRDLLKRLDPAEKVDQPTEPTKMVIVGSEIEVPVVIADTAAAKT